MASLNQNFTKYAYDTFTIQFTITTDVEDISNYKAYWSAGPVPNTSVATVDPTKKIIKTSPNAFGNVGGISYQADNKFLVSITRSDFGWLDDDLNDLDDINTTYEHELVLADNNGQNSVVVSRGTFTLNKALFPSSSRA